MASGAEMRKYLDEWSAKGGTSGEAADAYPDCGCEAASPHPGGLGPVGDDEMLRHLIASRSQVDLKRPNKASSKFTHARMSRIFDSGLSVFRYESADAKELEFGAREVYQSALKRDPTDTQYSGICGVLDFPAGSARWDIQGHSRLCCVFETPLDERPSHADIVYHRAKPDDPEEALEIKAKLLAQIGGNAAIKGADTVAECDLVQFLPECMREI